MENNELLTELQDTLTLLDAEECPEAYAYLSGLADDESTTNEDPYDIANMLLDCDGKGPLPTVLRVLTVTLLQAAFEGGNADAMNDLGAQYYTGSRGFEQDFGKAVEYYLLAAESGSRQAQENLGYCYYYGRNVPVDYEKAFHYFALGAFDGHLISLYKIGDMYANGYYVAQNEKEAFCIYEHCLNTMTDADAAQIAGPLYLRLGKAFLYGKGTKPDAKCALICYQKAQLFLMDMVANGNEMYRKSLDAAIDGEAKAREQLMAALPQTEWPFD